MKKTYKLTIAYDGTRYYGWEHQPGRDTIQGKLEGVLERLVGEFVDVIGAGRTDAGVHARAMVAHAVFDSPLAEEEIRDYMNRYLPEDIAVRDVAIASDRFHARYKAVGKTYCYTCFDGPVKPVFDRKYVTILKQSPDVEAMQRAAGYLEGKQDFASFCGNPRMKKSTVRVVDRIEITKKSGYIRFTFHGTGFLQNMVRILVGTLLEVGYGHMEPERVRDILAARDRKLAGPTAPSQGLCLIKVDY
ncbi:MAG TPA: tRNA pseudouridine(38-40) synthase TruA [Lachnospiraceae bacterium]|nr:tRNA pseudouridine(38-40) synthase TruA [Lachnospiraceae bacterium]